MLNLLEQEIQEDKISVNKLVELIEYGLINSNKISYQNEEGISIGYFNITDAKEIINNLEMSLKP
jgi:hypothetical protein